jgi:FkbM family methyltransferase
MINLKNLFLKKEKYSVRLDKFIIKGDKFHLGGIKSTKSLNNGFKIIKKILPENPVIIDVGAYIGSYSLRYSTIPDSLIYAIEPIKSNFNLLSKNIQENKVDNVRYYNLGMSNKNGKMFFGNPTKKQGWRFTLEDCKDKAFSSVYADKVFKNKKIINGEYSVVQTIDNFVAKSKIKKVDFIKIDAEGHDLNILKGANKIILKYKPILQVEAIDYILQLAGLNVDDLINYIKGLNLYNLYYFTKNSKSIKKIEKNNYPRGMNLLLIPKK